MSFRSKCQKIGDRDWELIVENWAENVPDITEIGSRPPQTVSDVLVINKYTEIATEGQSTEDIVGLRKLALWEAIYLLHKGAHVMRAAQSNSQEGKLSWSMFSAYHGAYLLAKAIMSMLGVSIAQAAGPQLLIDFFPVPTNKNRRGGKYERRQDTFCYYNLGQIDQQNLWELFQRVIRKTNAHFLSKEMKTLLADDIDWAAVSRRRNPFIYSIAFWPFGDLHSDSPTSDFCYFPQVDGQGVSILSVEADTFLLEYGFVLQYLAEKILSDVAGDIPALMPEFEKLFSQHSKLENAPYCNFSGHWNM